MRATISLDSLWQTIQSLSLNNQEWLLDKLQENIREQKKKRNISARKKSWQALTRG